MVGLPARGKSSVARRLYRYLSWLGYRTRIFNLGDYRRRVLGGGQGPDFFAPDNVEGVRQRNHMVELALDDVAAWFSLADELAGHVAIFDATNSTKARRAWLLDRGEALGAKVLFVESMTEDDAVITANVREKQLHSPDFVDLPPDAATADFQERLAHYEVVYEPIDESEEHLSYAKIIDVGRRIIANRIQGYVPTRATTILMNMHIVPRPILLTRHGESEDNAAGRIGGDTDLTPAGRSYGKALAAWVHERFGDDKPAVWTSTLRRTRRTAEPLGLPTRELGALDEIDGGVCDGLTYDEIRVEFPDEYEARQEDKLRYRYPQGESYLDLIERLHPVIIELERIRRPVLVVAHQAIVRCLYAYFTGEPLERVPHLRVPLHEVVELTPTSYGCTVRRTTVSPPSPERS
jgi:broad specificity phosphatase PhoE